MSLFDQAGNLSRLKNIDYLYRERDGTEIDVIQFSKAIIKRYIHSITIKDINIFTSMYRTSGFSRRETEFFNSIHDEVALNSKIPNHKFQECYYTSRNKDIFKDLPGERFSLQKKEDGTLYFDGGPINSENELRFLNYLTKTQNKEKMQSYLVSGLFVEKTIFIPDF